MTDRMTDGISALERRAARLAGRLRRELEAETDLWPRIAARIESELRRSLGQLPSSLETERDLWPGIRSRIDAGGGRFDARARRGPRGTGWATAAGIVAVGALTLLVAGRLGDLGTGGDPPVVVEPGAAELPAWMADTLARFATEGAGAPIATLGDVARSIERDFLMVRAERLRIEQALAAAGANMNLRAQWRQVYRAELRLIDETERLASIYGTRVRI